MLLPYVKISRKPLGGTPLDVIIWIWHKVRTAQKEPSVVDLIKRCFENMKQICRRTSMLKCDFNKAVCNFWTTKFLFRRNNRIWRKGLVCKASSVPSNQTRWYNKRILRKGYSIPRDFLWIENYKVKVAKQLYSNHTSQVRN